MQTSKKTHFAKTKTKNLKLQLNCVCENFFLKLLRVLAEFLAEPCTLSPFSAVSCMSPFRFELSFGWVLHAGDGAWLQAEPLGFGSSVSPAT